MKRIAQDGWSLTRAVGGSQLYESCLIILQTPLFGTRDCNTAYISLLAKEKYQAALLISQLLQLESIQGEFDLVVWEVIKNKIDDLR